MKRQFCRISEERLEIPSSVCMLGIFLLYECAEMHRDMRGDVRDVCRSGTDFY